MFKRIPNQRKIGMTTTGLRNFKKVYTIKLVHTVQKKNLNMSLAMAICIVRCI